MDKFNYLGLRLVTERYNIRVILHTHTAWEGTKIEETKNRRNEGFKWSTRHRLPFLFFQGTKETSKNFSHPKFFPRSLNLVPKNGDYAEVPNERMLTVFYGWVPQHGHHALCHSDLMGSRAETLDKNKQMVRLVHIVDLVRSKPPFNNGFILQKC